MVKTLTYNSANIKMIYDHLVNHNNQGVSKDFEIRIDDLTTIHRTDDLGRFYLFKKSLTHFSNEISFILYKSKSRRNDKYILVRKGNVSPDPKMTTQEYIDKEVAKALKRQEQQLEFARLEDETQSQKQTITALRARVLELETKNKGDLKELIQLISMKFGSKPTTQADNKDVNGVSTDDLVKMINHYRQKFGEKVFEDAMGIALQVADHPKIINEVKQFINQKITSYENK